MITHASSPKWANHNHTAIDMFVLHSEHGEIPFTASPDDNAEHGRELFRLASLGEFGEVAPYDGPSQEEITASQVRAERDSRLAACDWTQSRDVPIALAESWGPYRQALRDITLQEGFPLNVIWPDPPTT